MSARQRIESDTGRASSCCLLTGVRWLMEKGIFHRDFREIVARLVSIATLRHHQEVARSPEQTGGNEKRHYKLETPGKQSK